MQKITIAIVSLVLGMTGCGGDKGGDKTEKKHIALAEGPQIVMPSDYCGELQGIMASTSLDVINVVHSNYNSFVKSKASTEPLTTHQYLNYLPLTVKGSEQNFPAIISCKLKTADRLIGVYGEGKAGEELSCRDVLQRDLAVVVDQMQGEKTVFDTSAIVLDEDDVARMGPRWLQPWPYPIATTDGKNILHLRSKSLLVPFSVLIPMPDRFKGTHYCHLPTPQYLRAILLGDITVPAAS